MIEKWREEKINFLIGEIKEYFQDCSVNYPQFTYSVEKLNEKELKYLNENLNLKEITGTKDENILLKLLDDSTKDNFCFFLINSLGIELNVNGFDELKNTVFSKLAKKYFDIKGYFQKKLITQHLQKRLYDKIRR